VVVKPLKCDQITNAELVDGRPFAHVSTMEENHPSVGKANGPMPLADEQLRYPAGVRHSSCCCRPLQFLGALPQGIPLLAVDVVAQHVVLAPGAEHASASSPVTSAAQSDDDVNRRRQSCRCSPVLAAPR
jgi:hypothetical protein